MKNLESAVKKLVSNDMINCSKCGQECEYGWDAHAIITSGGLIEICDDCYKLMLKEMREERNKSFS